MTLRTSTVAALALGLSCGGAAAGGPPLTLALPGTVTFPLAGPADYQDVLLDAVAGVDTWIGLKDDFDGAHVGLLDPSGATVATFDAQADGDGPEEVGVEFRAPASGRYVVRVGVPAATRYPATAGVTWQPDCRADAATRCGIAPGHTRVGAFSGGNDDDSFLVRARPGRRYVARLVTSYGSVLELVDGAGSVVKAQRVRGGAAEQRFYLPAAGGPYRLLATAGGLFKHGVGAPYTLALRPY